MSCEFCGHDNLHDYRCPNCPDPKIHGYCPICYTALRDDYTYFTDKDGYRYCSKECAVKNNQIEEKEWEEEDE